MNCIQAVRSFMGWTVSTMQLLTYWKVYSLNNIISEPAGLHFDTLNPLTHPRTLI